MFFLFYFIYVLHSYAHTVLQFVFKKKKKKGLAVTHHYQYQKNVIVTLLLLDASFLLLIQPGESYTTYLPPTSPT